MLASVLGCTQHLQRNTLGVGVKLLTWDIILCNFCIIFTSSIHIFLETKINALQVHYTLLACRTSCKRKGMFKLALSYSPQGQTIDVTRFCGCSVYDTYRSEKNCVSLILQRSRHQHITNLCLLLS